MLLSGLPFVREQGILEITKIQEVMIMKRIILTGGGTAGHVTPNIALIPRLRELGYDIQYVASYTGIERSSSNLSAFPITEFLPENCGVISACRILQILSV